VTPSYSIFLLKILVEKINYEIHDKELLTIINAFEEWLHIWKEAQYTTTIYKYHKNLEYFMNACIFNYHQARWNMS